MQTAAEAEGDLPLDGAGSAPPESVPGARHAAPRRQEGPVPHPEARPGDGAVLQGLIESGAFKPVVDRPYPLDQIVEAYRYVETGQKIGNVVISLTGRTEELRLRGAPEITAAVRRTPRAFLAGACPIVGSYGAKDRTQRGAAQRLERALTANGIEHDVKEYPDAGHSFLNDHRDLLFRMMSVAGIGYHEPSAQDARRRIVSFFDTHLKS